jgi:hypothetical protein
VDGQDTFFIWLLFPIAEDSKSVAQVLKTGKQGGAVVAAGSHPCTHEVKVSHDGAVSSQTCCGAHKFYSSQNPQR